jgi:hypothetical protein
MARKKVAKAKKPTAKKGGRGSRGPRRKPVDIETPVAKKADEPAPQTRRSLDHEPERPVQKSFSKMNDEEKKVYRRWWRWNRKRKALETAARAGAAGATAAAKNGNGTQGSAPMHAPASLHEMFRIVGERTPNGEYLWRAQIREGESWSESGGTLPSPEDVAAYIDRKVELAQAALREPAKA